MCMATPSVTRASEVLQIEYDGQTYEKKPPMILADVDRLELTHEVYAGVWTNLIEQLKRLKLGVPGVIDEQNKLRKAHDNNQVEKPPKDNAFAETMSDDQWTLGPGSCQVHLKNMVRDRNQFFVALVYAVREINQLKAVDAGGITPAPAVDTLVGGSDNDMLLLDMIHTMSSDEGSSGGSHRSSTSASSGGDTAATGGGGSPPVDTAASTDPPVQNGAEGGASASALAVLHASHTQDSATTNPAEAAAVCAEIVAELSQTRQIREELAKTKREHEKQVADLQKQLDSEHQKRLEGDNTIAGLRLEPTRERDLKEQHRMALNVVEKERDALKANMTKMNDSLERSD